MSNEEVLTLFNSPDSKFYGTMYGQDEICVFEINGSTQQLDHVIEIKKSSLELTKNNDGFIFVWGWPGPDYNIYWFKDYGKTWAFELKDFDNQEREFWDNNDKIKKIKDII